METTLARPFVGCGLMFADEEYAGAKSSPFANLHEMELKQTSRKEWKKLLLCWPKLFLQCTFKDVKIN